MPTIHNTPPQYQTYILRCWETRSQQPDSLPAWRFSLNDSQTKEKHLFSNLETLTTFLQANFETHKDDNKHSDEWFILKE